MLSYWCMNLTVCLCLAASVVLLASVFDCFYFTGPVAELQSEGQFIVLPPRGDQGRKDNELSFLPWSPLGGAANAGGKGLLTDAAKFPNLNRIAAAKQCRLGLILHAPLDKLLFLLTELTCKYCIFSFDLLHACV